MQTAKSSAVSTSVVRMFASTFREQGIRGLYRGVSAPLIAVTPIFAVSFWGYDVGKQIVARWSILPTTADDLTLTQKCIAGGISAIPTTLIMAPSERCVLICGWFAFSSTF
jgi:solute carrier family 25 (mitochondrial carnitine/acylcarnitine transporter), member 20/29